MSTVKKVILADDTEYAGEAATADAGRDLWVELDSMDEQALLAAFIKFRDPEATKEIKFYSLGEIRDTFDGYIKMVGFYDSGDGKVNIRMRKE